MYGAMKYFSRVFFCSMYDTFTDEFGMVDFKRSKNGSGMSQHSQVSGRNTHIPLPCPSNIIPLSKIAKCF